MVMVEVMFKADGPKLVSAAVLSTMVCPASAGVKVMVPPGQRSAMAWRSEPAPALLVFNTVMFGTQAGPVTVMVKVHDATLVQVSVAVQFTVLVPTGKGEPEGGVQLVEVTAQLSVADAAKVTLLEVTPLATDTAMLAGHTITGGMVSRTVMVRVAEVVLVQLSVAVQVQVMIRGQVPLVVQVRTTGTGPQLSVAVTGGRAGTSPRHW